VPFSFAEQRRGWRLMTFPCLRNARPQKDSGERPGALLARRAPTMKQWSLDARSKGQPRPLP
jgi:hypothetical protein